MFCDEIAKGTRNRNACQHVPNPQLGGVREVIEAVQLGTQDRVDTSTGLVGWWAGRLVGNFVPQVERFDIPFLVRDDDHARKVMDGPIGQDLLKKL